MSELGKIEIRISGTIGNEPLSPDNYDIKEIRTLFDVVESLLYPNQKAARAPITYSMEKGSVKNIFKTTLQSAASFLAVISLVQKNGNLDGLELQTAKAFHEVQKSALKNDFVYEFGSPDDTTPLLTISRHTKYQINEELWADAEFYFYGLLVNAGGKEKSNIHILTKDKGLLIINTEKKYLQEITDNVLYKYFSVRAKGRQNINSGEIDSSSLQLLELNLYNPSFNEEYISSLVRKATPFWKDIDDIDNWISNIRGFNG